MNTQARHTSSLELIPDYGFFPESLQQIASFVASPEYSDVTAADEYQGQVEEREGVVRPHLDRICPVAKRLCRPGSQESRLQLATR